MYLCDRLHSQQTVSIQSHRPFSDADVNVKIPHLAHKEWNGIAIELSERTSRDDDHDGHKTTRILIPIEPTDTQATYFVALEMLI